MRSLLLTLTFLLGALHATEAQTKKELAASLSRDLTALNKATRNMKLDSVIMFMPPAIFEIVPKDTLIAQMQKAFDNEYFSMQMGEYQITKVPKPKKAGKYHYSLVSYHGDITMKYKTESATNSMMAGMMKMQFGKDNVVDNGAEGLKILLKNKTMIAFKDPDAAHWYILEDKRKSAESQMMELLVPEEVLKALPKVN